MHSLDISGAQVVHAYGGIIAKWLAKAAFDFCMLIVVLPCTWLFQFFVGKQLTRVGTNVISIMMILQNVLQSFKVSC